MITKNKLQSRVSVRKRELEATNAKLRDILEKLRAFVTAIKSNSLIFGLICNLSVWKEIEKLLSAIDEK